MASSSPTASLGAATSAVDDSKSPATDLPDNQLALTSGSTSSSDSAAAGLGSAANATANQNAEPSGSGQLAMSTLNPQAVDSIDLLTVAQNELGHALGLSDTADAMAA
jgi:hypothetical protein